MKISVFIGGEKFTITKEQTPNSNLLIHSDMSIKTFSHNTKFFNEMLWCHANEVPTRQITHFKPQFNLAAADVAKCNLTHA